MSLTALCNSQDLPRKTRKINNVVDLYEYAERKGYRATMFIGIISTATVLKAYPS